jgi:outer membrane lipase/esterase
MQSTSIRRVFALASLAVAAVSLPVQALAFSGVVIFGDSLSDSGNNSLALTGGMTGAPQVVANDGYVPSLPYSPSGTYSNGPVWASSFAAQLGMPMSALPSLTGVGTNFAFGGAKTSVNGPPNQGGFPFSLSTQVGMAIGGMGGQLPNSALYVVAGGGNDARAALEALGANPSFAQVVAGISQVSAAFAIDVGNIVDTLQAAGAQNIVVWNAPNLGAAPAVRAQGAGAAGLATLMTASMNSALDYRLSTETGVTTFDLFGMVSSIAANPGAYGLDNVTNACGALVNNCNPATALFWDGIHPTAAAHLILANAMVAAVVPEPGVVWLMMAGLVGMGAVLRRRQA